MTLEIQSYSDNHKMIQEEQTSHTLIGYCEWKVYNTYANKAAATAAPIWRIRKYNITVTWSVTETDYQRPINSDWDADWREHFIWDDREALSYK